MKSCKIMMICLFVSIGLLGHAKASDVSNAVEELTSFTRVMSYDELMMLSPDGRIEYVQGLRELLVEMEQSSQDTAQVDSLRRMLRMLEAWIPEAQAFFGSEETDPRSQAVPVVESANGISVVRCPSRTDTVLVRGRIRSRLPSLYVCQVGEMTTEPCPKGFVAVMQEADSKFRCASKASFENLTMTSRLFARTKNKKAAKSGNAQANSIFDVGGPSAASLQAIVDQQKEADKKLAEAQEKAAKEAADRVTVSRPARPASAATATTTATTTKAPKPKAKSAARKAETSASGSSAKPAKKSKATSNSAKSVASAGQSEEAGETPHAEEDSQSSAKSKRETASMASCSPDASLPATCNAKTVEAARKRYANDPNPDCIYAGSVSVYKDGQKKSFGCAPPTKFCFGSGNCESDVGGKMEAAYSCGAGQVICNPMLFGIKSDGETPFCVSRQKNATLACENESSGEKARHPFLSSKANPTGWKKTTGLREAWDEFARRLFQLCHKNQVSMALHCRECHVIKKKLFDLNVAVRGVKNCGAALRFQKDRCDANGTCTQPAKAGARGSSTVTENEKKTDRVPATDSSGQSPSIEVPGEKPPGTETQPSLPSDERSNSLSE